MCVDSATYAVNIYAEYHKEQLGPRRSAQTEIAASLLSVVALLAVTGFVMADAIIVLTASPSADIEDVDPVIMLAFTSVNLLVDFGMCGSIILRETGGIAGCICARCGVASFDASSASVRNRVRTRKPKDKSPLKYSEVLKGRVATGIAADEHVEPVSEHVSDRSTDVGAISVAIGSGGSGPNHSSQSDDCGDRCMSGCSRARSAVCEAGVSLATPAVAGSTADMTGARGMTDVESVAHVHTSILRSDGGAGNEGNDEDVPAAWELAGFATELDLSPRSNLNLCSAFAHVLADTMRTFTVMIAALLVKIGGLDSSTTDAVGSLVVCGVILVVAAYVCFEALMQARSLLNQGPGLDGGGGGDSDGGSRVRRCGDRSSGGTGGEGRASGGAPS